MERKQIKRFEKWFHDYVAGFYGEDKFVNANIRLKEKHTLRVHREMLYLIGELGLSAGQGRIAEVTALFHDIGRFGQFIKYRTYNDCRSTNHCLLGLDVLRETKILDSLGEKERQLIEKAVKFHGVKQLPRTLAADDLLFARLIRDADKLDVFYTVISYYRRFRKNPKKFNLELEFPDKRGYSAEVVEDILNERRTSYSSLRTFNDMKLLQLGWVYDVNFVPTLKRIKKRRFMEIIISFLPQTAEIKKVGRKIFEYIEQRIESGK